MNELLGWYGYGTESNMKPINGDAKKGRKPSSGTAPKASDSRANCSTPGSMHSDEDDLSKSPSRTDETEGTHLTDSILYPLIT